MNVTDDDIRAYVAGALSLEVAAHIDAAIAADVMVAARVEREKRLRAQLRGAFDPAYDGQTSDRFHAGAAVDETAIGPRARVADDDVDEHSQRIGIPPRWRTPVVVVVASLAAFAASMWLRPDAPVQMRNGVLVAQGRLAHDLDGTLANAPSADAAISIVLTFRDTGGRVCPGFSNATLAMAGLACRDGERWLLPVVTPVGAGEGGDMHTASHPLPAEVQAAIDTRLQGRVFDAMQERAARDAGWR